MIGPAGLSAAGASGMWIPRRPESTRLSLQQNAKYSQFERQDFPTVFSGEFTHEVPCLLPLALLLRMTVALSPLVGGNLELVAADVHAAPAA